MIHIEFVTMSDKKEKLVVCLSGGGPWGFRLTGGAGTGLPLVVSKVSTIFNQFI